jgi:hypothetical protein
MTARPCFTDETYETVDASGDLRVEAIASTQRDRPAAVRTREDVWAVDPRCIECHTIIPSPAQAAMLSTAAGKRIACAKGPCFRAALVMHKLVPLIPQAVRVEAHRP